MPSLPELKLDRGDENAFVRYFKNTHLTGSEDRGVLRFFSRNDTYSVHGPDASYVAQTVYKSSTVLRHWSDLAYVTLSQPGFQSTVRDALLHRGLKIELYEGRGADWSLTKRASPGNLEAVEDLIGEQTQNPVIAAIKASVRADTRTLGVCFVDAGQRLLGLAEFDDNELYSNLESLVIQLGVRECVVAESEDLELAKIREMIGRCDVVVTQEPPATFKRDLAALQVLLRPEDSANIDEDDTRIRHQLDSYSTALDSANALVNYLDLQQQSSSYTLVQHDLAQYMRLDASALRALHLMPSGRDGAKAMSVYGLLNKTKSAGGARLLAQWLKQPLLDQAKIEQRLDLVQLLVEDAELRQTLQQHLQTVPDISRLVRRFQRGAASLEQVVRIYQVALKMPDFVDTCSSSGQPLLTSTFGEPLQEYATALEKLQEMVETTVVLEALDRHEFVIKPDFDQSLQVIDDRLKTLMEEMQLLHQEAAADLRMDQRLKLEDQSAHGWSFRLTRTDASCLRSAQGYQELATVKAGVIFTSSALKKRSAEYAELSSKYKRTQSGLVKEVVAIAATYCPVLERVSLVLSHLDVVVSLAHVAVYAPTQYVRPRVHERHTGRTVLTESRHPCLEVVQDDRPFIANDVALERGKSEFVIITGPNMGGKSTYIRQIGVIALMAQIGSFVPCATAEVAIVDCILARVGAGDSQLKGVSTFMAEMLETSAILRQATRESLVIVDELGRGTSTYDGFGLAWAISEHLVKNIGCLTLFATHFHELTDLAQTYPTVTNLHVAALVGDDLTANDKDITLLYKVKPGSTDQSFGIHVAEAVRFPEKVVRMAKRKAQELEGTSESTGLAEDEIQRGHELLRKVLKQWAGQVDEGDNVEDAVGKLKGVMGQFQGEIASDRYLQEVVGL